MGVRKVTGELAGDIADHFYFLIFFLCGGECGVEVPLLRNHPSSGMVRVVYAVRSIAAAVSTT